MSTDGVEEASRHEDATATMKTGIHGQNLVINGWFASHADTGRPGPHVHLGAHGSTMQGAVLQTSQVPELVACLNLVAERIDRQWEREADEFLTTFGDAPDDNDPAVIRQRRIDQLVLDEKIAEHSSEIVDLILRTEDIHEATTAVATLLDVQEEAIQVRLLNFSLFGLTRGSRVGRADQLRRLRDEA